MGMFDTFYVHQLGGDRDFQTKDLDCRLDYYKVNPEGLVLKARDNLDPDKRPCYEPVNLGDQEIEIYDLVKGTGRMEYFKLEIRGGRCVRIYRKRDEWEDDEGPWQKMWSAWD